jgi:hypothetical protein
VNYYLPLDAVGRAVFERILEGEEYTGVRTMNKTPYDKGVEAGQVDLATRTLEKKFGPLPAEARERLTQLALDELTDLTLRIGTAGSLAELGLVGETVAHA